MDRPTKKELKEQRKLDRLQQMEQQSTSSKTKWIVISVVSVLFLAFFAFVIIFSKQNKPTETVTLSDAGQKVGSGSANVTLVEFGDFQCPACASYEPTLQQVREAYGDEITFIFKHFPLKSIHSNAMPAAVAAEAAARQGKFWEYHDLLYARQQEWSNMPNAREKFVEYASELELDTDQFAKDMQDKALEESINKQLDEGINAGVNATPTFYLNGEYLNVNASFDSFKNAIENVLSSQKGQ